MNDDRTRQHTMIGAVSRFSTDRADEIAVVPAATEEAADVTAAYKSTDAALANPLVQTKEVTEKANKARKLLRTSLPALLGPLSSVATKASDIDLLAKATLRSRQLDRLSDPELNTLADQLIGLGEAQPAAVQTKYSLPLILPTLRGYQTDFAPLVGSTQDLIDERSGDNRSAEDLLQAAMQQVYELDKVMKIFKILNPKLYADYRKARKIGKRPGGGEKKARGGDGGAKG